MTPSPYVWINPFSLEDSAWLKLARESLKQERQAWERCHEERVRLIAKVEEQAVEIARLRGADNLVAVQVGQDVVVFAESPSPAEAIVLVGRSLADAFRHGEA